jgi:hypothetical protein
MKFFHVFQLLVACALFQLCWLNHATAQSSPALNIQGVLRNSINGAAAENGVYKIKFSLYTGETGGLAVWSETQDSVVVNGGVYSTSLGKKTPMNAAFDQVYYLGVKVGSGQEMTPRALLSSAPYALSLIGQSNTFPSTGPVGVGTASPTTGTELHVKDASAGAQVLIEGATGSEIKFKKEADSASITYDGTNINIQNLNLVFDNGINLPAGQSVKYNGLADWRLVDLDDFETSTEGWETNNNSGERQKIGAPTRDGYVYYGSNGTWFHKAINLAGITHKQVKVVLNVYFLDRFQDSDVFEMFGAFSHTASPNGGVNGDFIPSWSRTKSGGYQVSGTFFYANGGDSVERAEMVIASSSDTIHAFINGINHGNFGSVGISDVEIYVR